MAKENNELIYLYLEDGRVTIETRKDVAPNHVKRIKNLVLDAKYDGVVFHRVIEGFMAQTGDVEFGNINNDSFNLKLAGTGSSNLPDLKEEFSDLLHGRGAVSMARSNDPNSANSQFFICLDDASHLDGQYTIWGQVTEGMEFVDLINKGDGPNGSVSNPDKIIKMEIVNQ